MMNINGLSDEEINSLEGRLLSYELLIGLLYTINFNKVSDPDGLANHIIESLNSYVDRKENKGLSQDVADITRERIETIVSSALLSTKPD